MNIKSLLLGSVAALAAASGVVSGARAADAVVMAEPEPMEYVRVCDVYGEGFFYIPGTETCLKLAGYVRADIRGGDLFDSPEDSYDALTRFTFFTDARTETELGTLRSFTELRFDWENGGGTEPKLKFGYVELAGFRIGTGESAFTVFPSYGSNVINDDVVPFGPYDTNFVQYEADLGGGFSGTVSLEEGNNLDDGTDELISYVPHVVGGLKYEATYFAVVGVAGYDANNEEYAGKVRLDIKPSETFYGFVMAGYKTNDGEIEEHYGNLSDGSNFYGNWEGGEEDKPYGGDGYGIWGGFSYVFTPAVTLNTAASYDEGENFYAAAQLNLQPVEGLSIQPEVGYLANFGDDGTVDDGDLDNDDDAWGATLRVQRDF